MTTLSIRFVGRGLEDLEHRVEATRFQQAVSIGLTAGAEVLKGKIATYPASPGGRPQFPHGFKSDRQRRFFFGALASGDIEVPWRRGQSDLSEKLGQSWSVQSLGWNAKQVGTSVSYAPFVQGPEDQSAYHQATGWKTTRDVVEADGAKIADGVREEIAAWLEGN